MCTKTTEPMRPRGSRRTVKSRIAAFPRIRGVHGRVLAAACLAWLFGLTVSSAAAQDGGYSETRFYRPGGYSRAVARSSNGPAVTGLQIDGRGYAPFAIARLRDDTDGSAEAMVEDVRIAVGADGRRRAYVRRRTVHTEVRVIWPPSAADRAAAWPTPPDAWR